jgi:prepilin-type N-terminal cleavage/methylation domain-containing protein
MTIPSPGRQRGFTLIEVLLAMTITSVVMVTVATTFHVMLNARDVVDDLAESTEAGPRILNLIERDLRAIWTYNVHNNAVFRGRDMDVGGRDADRMDFLTSTDAVGTVLDLQNIPRKPTLCEVGYWFKPNQKYRDVFEMWRREDPMVDDDIITQGSFQLVHDRVKNFKVTYYRTLGHEAPEELQWDSAVEDKLPKRIKIEFTIERKRSSRNVVNDAEIDDFEGAEKTYVRHFVFDSRFDDVLSANTARIPVLPPEPVAQAEGGGGGGAAGEAGKGGGGGGGGKGAGGLERTVGGAESGPAGRGGRTGAGRGGAQGRPAGGNRGPAAPPGGMPPGFNPSEFLNRIGGGGGGGGGGLFGGR